MNPSDRRHSNRFAKPIDIELWCDATHHHGRIEDMGQGGFYVYTMLNWPVGQTLEFSFHLPDDVPEPIRGTGTVVWSEYMGFGVRFDSLDESSRERIRDVLGDDPIVDRRGASFDDRLAAASG